MEILEQVVTERVRKALLLESAVSLIRIYPQKREERKPSSPLVNHFLLAFSHSCEDKHFPPLSFDIDLPFALLNFMSLFLSV